MSDHTDIGSPPPVVASDAAIDGLDECAIGALFLVLAALWSVNPGLVPIGAGVAVIFGPSLLRRLRELVGASRIGQPPGLNEPDGGFGPGPGGVAVYVAGAATVFLIVIALTGELGVVEDWRRWGGLLAGLLSAGGFLASHERSGLKRHLVLAVLSAIIGFTAGVISDGSTYESVGRYLLLMGAIVMMLGLAELTLFVRRYPKPVD